MKYKTKKLTISMALDPISWQLFYSLILGIPS